MTQKPNKLERLKSELPPAQFAPFLETLDWENVNERERFYLKSFGIYNIKMRPDVYMLRLRIDGGQIGLPELEVIAALAQEHELNVIITARAQIELHGIAPGEVYAVYTALHRGGITTHQTLTDNFRAITTDPYDGAAADSRIDTQPLVAQIRERILDRPEWMGTIPRKFNTAIIGRITPLVNPWANDLLFALAQRDGAWGFNVYLGGKNSEVARPVDIFILPEAVPDLFMAVAGVFQEHGLRGSRAKIRFFHLIESVGMAQVRDWIEAAMGQELSQNGELQMARAVPTGATLLGDGRYGEMVATRYGDVTADELLAVISRAHREHLEIHLGTDQNFHLIGVSHPPAPVTQTQIIACAGVRHCPLALWDIKHDVPALPLDRFSRHGITVGFSGCLKGCGRHYHSDIGLFGLRTNLYGETERAVRVYLGAIQSPDAAPGRMIYYSVPERKMEALLSVILDEYEHSGLPDFESYARHIRHYSTEWLQLWYLLHLNGQLTEEIQAGFLDGRDEKALVAETTEKLGTDPGEGYADAIRSLSHRVWDQTAG